MIAEMQLRMTILTLVVFHSKYIDKRKKQMLSNYLLMVEKNRL